MKKLYALLILLPFLALSQNNKDDHDYFIQFNSSQFSKKVAIDELFSHNLFKNFNKEDSDFKLKDFVSVLDQSKNVTIHGNFKDSISYTQITIPILDEKRVTALFEKKIQKGSNSANDKIVKKSNYSIYSPSNEDFSIAWNKKVLLIYINYESNSNRASIYNDYDIVEEAEYYEEEPYETEEVAIESTEIEEEYYEESVIESTETVEETHEYEVEEAEVDYDYEYDDEYYKRLREENEKRRAEERRLKHEAQSKAIDNLFKKGFNSPKSSNTNKNADISAWMNYESLAGKMSSFYYAFAKMSSNTIPYSSTYSIKGINMDLFFENEKVRMEQTVEYTKPLANIMKKVISRKPNENIYNYFPKKEPLGYVTYHMSSEEILKNYPAIIEQSFSSLPIEKEGIDIVMDLMSTMIDEEATATLLDGDFSLFFHGMEKYNHTFTTVEYDEDYEEIEVEKTIVKTKPVFSFIMTSTHPKMSEKLLKFGAKKEVLVQRNGNYKINESNEFGELYIIKEGDVLVFTNGLQHLNKGSQSDFSKKVAKETSENYFTGSFNIQDFIKSYMLVEDFGRDTAKALRFADQFRNIEMKSSNQLDGNKMKIEMNINSNFSNKNIILQTLDLLDYMN